MSEDLKAQFEQAVKDVNALTSRPSDQDLLELYGLFKQSKEGDVTGEKPGMFNFQARAKYEAWEELAGVSADEAMQRYIDKVRALGA